MKKYFSILIILCTVGIHAQELLPYPLDTINGEEFYRYDEWYDNPIMAAGDMESYAKEITSFRLSVSIYLNTL